MAIIEVLIRHLSGVRACRGTRMISRPTLSGFHLSDQILILLLTLDFPPQSASSRNLNTYKSMFYCSSLSSFRDQQPPPQVQCKYQPQSQGDQDYITNNYQYQYQSSRTYSALSQSQPWNIEYNDQTSPQSYLLSSSTSASSSVLPPHRIKPGMVANYLQPRYEKHSTSTFSWGTQGSQKVALKSPSPL